MHVYPPNCVYWFSDFLEYPCTILVELETNKKSDATKPFQNAATAASTAGPVQATDWNRSSEMRLPRSSSLLRSLGPALPPSRLRQAASEADDEAQACPHSLFSGWTTGRPPAEDRTMILSFLLMASSLMASSLGAAQPPASLTLPPDVSQAASADIVDSRNPENGVRFRAIVRHAVVFSRSLNYSSTGNSW